MKTGSIYIIRNTVNDKVYIGQTTVDIKTRFYQHCKNCTIKNRHYKLYNAMKKYGKYNFYCEVLEDGVNVNKLDEREIFYIKKYDSYENGYNSTKGGDGRTINNEYDEKEIVRLYRSGESEQSIALIYGVSGTTISRVLKKLGIKTRDNGNKYEQFGNQEFIEMWNNKNITIPLMANHYHVNEKTIRRHAKRLCLQNKKSIQRIEEKRLF